MVRKIVQFYIDGFRSMRLGKRLWMIVIIKLIIIFGLLKLFFPDVLKIKFQNDVQRSDFILQELTKTK